MVALALLSQLGKAVNLSNAPSENTDALDALAGASDWLQRQCKRRFDERIETRPYTALPIAQGGAIDTPELVLDDDLRSLTTLTNGDGAAITSNYLLRPAVADGYGVTAYRKIRLNSNSTLYWTSGVNDPVDSISVAGKWGYGGRWVATGATVGAGGQTDSATALSASATSIETGATLKIDAEYMAVTAGGMSTALTVERGVNGSTAAAHSAGTTIYHWQSLPLVSRLIVRLASWDLEKNKSPLFGQLVIGDISFAAVTDGLPKDLLHAANQLGLNRVVMPGAV